MWVPLPKCFLNLFTFIYLSPKSYLLYEWPLISLIPFLPLSQQWVIFLNLSLFFFPPLIKCAEWFPCMHAQSLQSCLTLCDPMDHSPPGSSIPYWSGLTFLPPGDILYPGTEHMFLVASPSVGGFFTTEPPGKSQWFPLSIKYKSNTFTMTQNVYHDLVLPALYFTPVPLQPGIIHFFTVFLKYQSLFLILHNWTCCSFFLTYSF